MSKNTKYFKTVQDVNNYYPDGVPSNVIAIVGDGSNVFISSDNDGSGNQQYYSADMTNDEIVAEQVQAAEQQGYDTGYTAGETAGYDTGYAAGQAAGGANWIDVLYLDEKAKAESFLGISDWGLNDFYKYNFAKYATSEPTIEQQSALTFILGLQNNNTMFKLIKITKDADDNAIITNNTCSINFDGTNVGAIALDGVTYYNKICIWGTLTLAAGDEVIMSCATKFNDIGTGDLFALGLFGGFNDETNDPATYKCETAGTYTFGIWVDKLDVQDGQAACFVSSMFNYEGSATVPAITVPTGETSGGSSEPTAEELDQQAYLFFTQGPGYENTNEVMNYTRGCGTQVSTIDDMDGQQWCDYLACTGFFGEMDFPYNIYITLYDPTQTPEFQWGTYSGYLTPSYNYSTDENGNDVVTVTFTPSNDCKIGFGLLPLEWNDETGDIIISTDCATISTFLKCFDNGETDEWDNTIYRHLTDVEAGTTYQATFSIGTDPESGDAVAEFSFTEVQP